MLVLSTMNKECLPAVDFETTFISFHFQYIKFSLDRGGHWPSVQQAELEVVTLLL